MTNNRVVHITSVHPPYDIRIFHKECRSLKNAGYDLSLIVPMKEAGEFDKDGISIIGVKQNGGRLKRFFFTVPKIANKAFRLNAPIYHLHDPELLVLGLILRICSKTVVFDMHENLPRAILTKNWIPKIARRAISMLVKFIERILLVRVPVVFAEKSYVKDYLWITNGIVVQNMPLLDEIQSIRENKNKILSLGYAGLVAEGRGPMQILKAIELVKKKGLNIRWECVGKVNSALKDKMMAYVKSNNLDVQLWGYLDAREALRIMARCHIGAAILEPLPNYLESYPTKMFEYMALGLPVISSNFPLYRSIIEEEKCGICIDPLNPEEIAQAIFFLAGNSDEAIKMGESGKHAVEKKYNWDAEKVKLIDFYNSLLTN